MPAADTPLEDHRGEPGDRRLDEAQAASEETGLSARVHQEGGRGWLALRAVQGLPDAASSAHPQRAKLRHVPAVFGRCKGREQASRLQLSDQGCQRALLA